ncbi:hypothetical protein [Campylobacter lari]|uniref:hypothetical protein n=1 Tax=Campylobacter lari TaxID=201 RepID=UPI0021530CAF|nr:hypothetical protein [Campylobacter lari]MCR6510337.1 hypothetical protein [Campylobacter lari]MCR6527485.1 hypothetical protein [Campylobacter lari]MCR6556975.1 hypothetical protein [Campylobacter lari]
MQKLLESYGILVQENIKDTNIKINENTITIHNSNISEIDLNILEQKQVNKITITNCEIDYIYFANNNIELFFSGCIFKNQIIAIAVIFNKEVIFSQCIFKKRIDFTYAIFNSYINLTATMFKNEARFVMTQFLADQTTTGVIENNFSEAVFKDKASFAMAKFKARVNFSITRFESEVNFAETKFFAEYTNQENIENDFRAIFFKDKVFFSRVESKARVNFDMTRFEGKARFINTSFFKNTIIFSEAEFNNVKFISDKERDKTSTNNTAKQTYHFQDITFKGIVNFENIHIKDLNFKNVIFNNIVVFDNTTLDSKPKFINCTFSNQFNIKHDCIQYDYNELKEKNKNTYNEFLNFRDLFRKLKSNHIAHHNLIDASELRAQELYARELELTHKENKNLKDTIEQWQLFFYRKLCDHHTDLVLNAKWLIITIGMFASMLFMIKLYKHGLCILNAFNFYGLYLSALGSFILSALALFRCIDTMKAFVSINAIIIFWVICYKPKLIFGIANLIGDNSYNAFENLLITLYTLIVGLIIFSLQKTARKNTIIPN